MGSRLRWLLGVALFAALAVLWGQRKSATPTIDHAVALRRAFPGQAASVLQAKEAFAAVGDGYAIPLTEEPGRAVERRGGLALMVPRRTDVPLRLHKLGGFEIGVREIGASGERSLAEGAVSYPCRGGRCYWAASDEGYEEWLLLDEGVATGEAPVATWEVDGATLRDSNGVVEVVDATDQVQLRVSAPLAVAMSGAPAVTRLSVRGAHNIELWVDSGGEPVLVDPAWSTAPSMGNARYGHAAVALNTTSVLVTGGYNGSYLATAEIYNSSTGRWSSTGPMATGRYYHQAVLLSSGKVLVCGGYGGTGALFSAEQYDPSTRQWTAAGTMVANRYQHAAAVLSDGKVLVTGGYNTSYLLSAERYDPATNSWSTAGTMATARRSHTATLLANGAVLVAGGVNASGYTAAAEWYVGGTSWMSVGPMATARAYHAAVKLPNNKVLVTGGGNGATLATAELFDGSGSWSSAPPMTGARQNHTATLLTDGTVVVTGGRSGTTYLATSEVYDPTANAWSSGRTMINARGEHAAAPTSWAKLLVAGGYNGTSTLAQAEVFDPHVDVWASPGNMASPRKGHTVTMLQNNKVLIVGGHNGTTCLATAQIYDPFLTTWSNTGPLPSAREYHTATLLSDGTVLVVGGDDGTTPQASAFRFNPSTGAWTAAGSLYTGVVGHTATLLANGKVLVAGGQNGSTYPSAAQYYDPTANQWYSAGTLSTAGRAYSASALLSTGQVAVFGGRNANYLAFIDIYTYPTGWARAGGMSTARADATATVLPNGAVLVAGGRSSATTPLTSVEIYNGTISTTGALSTARYGHVATRLTDGRILVAGGYGSTYLSGAEIYDPSTGLWQTGAPMLAARQNHAAAPLTANRVFVTGGNNTTTLSSTEIYTAVTIDDGNPCTTDSWNASLGQLLRVPVANGTPCNDGNPCTLSDSCQGGFCTGTPLVCPAGGQCENAGICDPGSGECFYPIKPNGTACNDGDACTQSDACQSGLCMGTTPVVCAPLDQCHDAGVCDTSTGVCSTPVKPNGTACNDGNACTAGDACQSGVCTTTPVTCVALDQCHLPGTCDPLTGCSNPAAPDGTLCDDGNPSTTADVCTAGVCAGTWNATVAQHGPDQPWVQCPGRTERGGADPLGPVIAHGYAEAPGSMAQLDLEQKTFLAGASLRGRSDAAMNSVIWEDLRFPTATPTDAQLSSWVTGAIRVANARVPAVATITHTSTTPTDDGAGHTLPAIQTWDLGFFHEGVVVMGSGCTLAIQAGTVAPATLVCRLEPGGEPISFQGYQASLAQAEQGALTATSTANLLGSSKRYRIVNGTGGSPTGAPQFVVYVGDGVEDRVVTLDGAGNVTETSSIMRGVTFQGVDLDFHKSPGITTLTAPVDNGNPNHVSLDTWYVAPASGKGNCDGTGKKNLGGFAICGNGFSGTTVARNGTTTKLLIPTSSNDFTSTLPPTTVSLPCSGCPPTAPAIHAGPASSGIVNSAVSTWPDNTSEPQNSHAHWAELQAFYSLGVLQDRYTNLGHFERCKLNGQNDLTCVCSPNAPLDDPCYLARHQAPFRLEVTVHAGGGSDLDPINKNVGLSAMHIGDLGTNTSNAWDVETISDASLVAHEYQHYVLSSIEARPGSKWLPTNVDVCALCGKTSMCPPVSGARECLHEGLADAFATLFTWREQMLPSFTAPFAEQLSCSDPDNYPDNPLDTTLHIFQRNACNSVVYGYWENGGDCPPGNPNYVTNVSEAHRRGTIMLGALYQFIKRYRDAGYGYLVPGMYMYQAQTNLVMPWDDERNYLDAMLPTILANNGRNLAQVAFAEKNVMPTLSCEASSSCTDTDKSQKLLSVAGPIAFDPGSSTAPEFKAYFPQGGYAANGTFELSDNPSFSTSNGGVVKSMVLPVASTPPNNSPAGFRRFTPSYSAVWSPVVTKATQNSDPRVYYRVTQCLSDGVTCANTAKSASIAPSVRLSASGQVSACSFSPGSAGNGLAVFFAATGGLLLLRSRRRRG
jgi:hypothetical protein